MSNYIVPALFVNVSIQLLCGALMSTMLAEGRGEECKAKHFMRIQEKCRDRNDALLEAEGKHDEGKVCTSLYKMWRCVARHVPVCFHRMTELYKMYFHSPHNCVLTVKQLQTLQNLTLTSAHEHNDTKDDVDISVDVVPLSPSTSPSPPLQSSTLLSSLVVVTTAEGGDEGGGGVNVTSPTGPGVNTTHHKHTGSDASSCCHCTFTKAAASWLVAWLITSSFLHS